LKTVDVRQQKREVEGRVGYGGELIIESDVYRGFISMVGRHRRVAVESEKRLSFDNYFFSKNA
jgi:hypothetical protein